MLKQCKVKFCNTKELRRGLCDKHYRTYLKSGKITKELHKPKGYWQQGLLCHFCTKQAIAEIQSKNVCHNHYRLIKYKNRTYKLKNDNGTGWVDQYGYRIISINGKNIREHRYIAEKALGHSLPKGAVVHHINHISTDNRPENLIVCPSQAYHLQLHLREKLYDITNRKSVRIMIKQS